MGGDTIISIIEESKSKLNQIEYFIISSHGLNNEVRKYLFDNDYSLINQDACFDDGDHYYEVNLFKKGKMQYDELDVEFGRILIEKCNLSFIENIKINVDKMHNLINKNNLPQDKIDEINKEINKYYSVLNLFNF